MRQRSSRHGRFLAVTVGVLVTGLVTGAGPVVAYAEETATTTLVSANSAGVQGNDYAYPAAISPYGRYVAFTSNATNLVRGDTNDVADVFVRNRATGLTRRVSVSNRERQATSWSEEAAMSRDARFVAFKSTAPNLVAGDTNRFDDVFVRDRVKGITRRVSKSSAEVQGNGNSYHPAISANGRYVAFKSGADNLVRGDTNDREDVFVRDRLTGTTQRVSVNSSEEQGSRHCGTVVAMSADGRYVAFDSRSTNLVPADDNGRMDVFVRDRTAGTTVVVSTDSTGLLGNGLSWIPSISADGRYVAFMSEASNLVEGDTNESSDVFLHDMVTGVTDRMSVSSTGTEVAGAWPGMVSADGRHVVFAARAGDLVPGDTNDLTDVFVRDWVAGVTERVSVSDSGLQANRASYGHAMISANGRYVAFKSEATNLVPHDTNGEVDAFLRDRG